MLAYENLLIRPKIGAETVYSKFTRVIESEQENRDKISSQNFFVPLTLITQTHTTHTMKLGRRGC
jgi:hypothetical protein